MMKIIWRNDEDLRLVDVIANRMNTKMMERYAGLFVVSAQWNKSQGKQTNINHNAIRRYLEELLQSQLLSSLSINTRLESGIIRLNDDNDMDTFCGDDNNTTSLPLTFSLPCPPEQLPVLMVVIHLPAMPQPHIYFMRTLPANAILKIWQNDDSKCNDSLTNTVQTELAQELQSFGFFSTTQLNADQNQQALRIFVAGDRMSVGKTSVCLGILGNLVAMGYPPETLAYIKPATQSESPQLVQWYCDKLGIPCVSVGPIVYYRGFTRAFLAGETETSAQLLHKVSQTVDELAIAKRVVIIDGVGFPAVGSICGTDNASVALASSYPIINNDDNHHQRGEGEASEESNHHRRRPLGVLLVGGLGVGSAVDAFNLNATYLERAGVPVLGAIFNKLSLEGYYSLENCKKEISLYFVQDEHQRKHGRRPFGFCPLFPKLGGKEPAKKEHEVLEFIRVFGAHVNVIDLLARAMQIKDGSEPISFVPLSTSEPPTNKLNLFDGDGEHKGTVRYKTRQDIEAAAIYSGAAPSA